MFVVCSKNGGNHSAILKHNNNDQKLSFLPNHNCRLLDKCLYYIYRAPTFSDERRKERFLFSLSFYAFASRSHKFFSWPGEDGERGSSFPLSHTDTFVSFSFLRPKRVKKQCFNLLCLNTRRLMKRDKKEELKRLLSGTSVLSGRSVGVPERVERIDRV